MLFLARCQALVRGQGVNVTALREIKLLKELRSPRLVQLIDVFPHKHSLLLVSYCFAVLA